MSAVQHEEAARMISQSSLPRPSACSKYHVDSDGNKLYDQIFNWVLPFHEPGLAPVGDESGAYHIHLDGTPAYSARFDRTFGYYCGLASVVDGVLWYHIAPDGGKPYEDSWNW